MHALIAGVVRASEEAPEAEDVVAGWTGFAVFLGLILAVAVIGFFLVRSLRRADSAEEQGLYDPKPTRGTAQQAEDPEPSEKSD